MKECARLIRRKVLDGPISNVLEKRLRGLVENCEISQRMLSARGVPRERPE